jgi:hypothetical protein
MFRKESLCLSLVGFLLGSYSCSFSLSESSSDSESVLVISIVPLLVFLCFFVGAVESVFSQIWSIVYPNYLQQQIVLIETLDLLPPFWMSTYGVSNPEAAI